MARTVRYAGVDDDVRTILKQVVDRVESDNTIAYFIDRACDLVDGHLAYKYSVPFASGIPLLKHASTSLAASMILSRIKIQDSGDRESWVQVTQQEGMDILNKIKDGTYRLVDSDGNDVTKRDTNYQIRSSTQSYTPTFNQGDEKSWQVDQDRIDDEAD